MVFLEVMPLPQQRHQTRQEFLVPHEEIFPAAPTRSLDPPPHDGPSSCG